MARKKAGRGGGKPRDPHPEEALRELEAQLERGLPPAIILRGEERYFRDRGIRTVVERAREAGMEICRHDAIDPEYSGARLIDDLATGALFESARCIVVQSVERIVVDRASQFSAAIRDAMRKRLEAGLPGCLVLVAEKLRADSVLVKATKAAGGPIVACRRLYETPPPWNPDPRNAELAQWTAARARQLGVQINAGEAAYVAAATGNDLNAIDDQLTRLVGGDGKAVHDLVDWSAGASAWEVAEHVVVGDLKRAALGLQTLFAGGATQRDGSRVLDLGGITAQLMTAIAAKLREAERGAAELRAGNGLPRAIEAAGVRGPKMAIQALEQRLAARAPEAWPRMIEEFGAIERRSRSVARVDANDFLQFALRWRHRKPGQKGGPKAGQGGRADSGGRRATMPT